MRARTLLSMLIGSASLIALGAGGWVAYDVRFRPETSGEHSADSADPHDHADKDRVRITPQARANLRLDVRPVQPQTYWRTIRVPGVVVERRGQSDRGVTAPIAGVVKHVHAVPGDTVRPGTELFVLGLTSEYL